MGTLLTSHEFTGNPSRRDSYEARPGFKQRGVDHEHAPKKYTRRYSKALKKSRGIKGRLFRNQGREYREGSHVDQIFIKPGTGQINEMHHKKESIMNDVNRAFMKGISPRKAQGDPPIVVHKPVPLKRRLLPRLQHQKIT